MAHQDGPNDVGAFKFSGDSELPRYVLYKIDSPRVICEACCVSSGMWDLNHII